MESEYYTIQEVADLLRLAYTTVRRLVEAGELHANKIGKQYRIERKDLDAYLIKTKTEKVVL